MPTPPIRSLRRLLLTHEFVFVLLVVITGGVGGTWGWQWQRWSAESIRLNQLAHTAQEIRSRLFKQIQEVAAAGLRGEDNVRALHAEHQRAIQELFNELRRQSAARAEDYAVQAMQTAFSLLQARLRDHAADSFELNRLMRAKLLDPEFERRFVADFEAAHVSFHGLVEQRLGAQARAIRQWTEIAPYALAGPVLIGFALLVFSRRSLTRDFVWPMRDIVAGIRRVSSGELQHAVPERGVAEMRELAQGINHMASELERSRDAMLDAERQAALGALVPVIAHNIRNPLAAIRANAQLLDGHESASECLEIRDDILTTVDRLGRWVNALVSYLHPLKPRRRAVAATAVMASARAMLTARLEETGVTCVCAPWDEDALLDADPDLLEQAVYGLLNNALEASHRGGVVTLSVTAEAGGVCLGIADEAGGLPFTPEPAGLVPGPTTKRFGTGLGIPIAYKICQTHGYRLEFATRPEGGTRVTIKAPAYSEHAALEYERAD